MGDTDTNLGPRKLKLEVNQQSKGAKTSQEGSIVPSGTSHSKRSVECKNDKQSLHENLAKPDSSVKNKAPKAYEQRNHKERVLTERKHDESTQFFPARTEEGKLAKANRTGRPTSTGMPRIVSDVSEQPYRSPLK
jgi:hypothetical protein